MLKGVFLGIGTLLILAIGISFLPIDKINWGRISILPAATITVTGTSEGNIANSQASFGATVSSTNANKQTAVNDVNTKMTALIKSLKDFGIADADIKTDNVNVYQMPVSPVPVPQTFSAGDLPADATHQALQAGWQASNSITITLKDVSKSSALSDLLNNSGATSVYGPNLSTGSNTSASDADLLAKAVADAKLKADVIAKAGGQTVGKMINVQESGSNYPMPMMFSAKDNTSSGSPIQPGTSSLSKSVTVVYELK